MAEQSEDGHGPAGAVGAMAGSEQGEPASIRKVAFASAVGATIEWYDFFIYGTAAGLVLNQLFFPPGNPTAATLAAYATFAVGFFARPIGGVVFGHYGDRLGRKAMLVLTILIMGLGTFLIGLLPTYESIGIWAPILLVALRILQGIGLGGEWGGAVLMAVEHAPPDKRGWYGSWPQMGVPAGLLLGTLMFTALSALPDEQFLAWGWRIAFLSSAVLLVVGTYIRVKISETPAFAKVKEAHSEPKVPIADLIRTQPRHVLLACGARIADGVSFNIWGVFSIAYATTQLGLPRTTILTAVSVAAAVMFVMIGVWGAMSDRWGRRPVMGTGAAAFALFALPGFLLVNTGEPLWITVALVVAFGLIHPALYTVMAPFFSELFEARYRYTGVSFTYQFPSIFASGLTPLIATALLAAAGGAPWYFVAYAATCGLISLICIVLLPETRGRDIMPAGEVSAPASRPVDATT